jgi:hypothetical protein
VHFREKEDYLKKILHALAVRAKVKAQRKIYKSTQ